MDVIQVLQQFCPDPQPGWALSPQHPNSQCGRDPASQRGRDFPPELADLSLLQQVSTDRPGGVFKSRGQTSSFLES